MQHTAPHTVMMLSEMATIIILLPVVGKGRNDDERGMLYGWLGWYSLGDLQIDKVGAVIGRKRCIVQRHTWMV